MANGLSLMGTRIVRLGNPGWIYQADNYLVETLCETADGAEAA